MKKQIPLLCSLILVLCLLLAPCTAFAEEAAEPIRSGGKNTSAQKAMPITEAGVTDALNKETAERWYTLTITVPGDAVLLFDSSAFTYNGTCWECAFIDQDGTTQLSVTDSGTGRTYLSATDLTEGTYYLRVRKVQKENPAGVIHRYGFCDGEYTLHVVTCATPVAADPATHTVSKAGELLCIVNGTLFLKAYDGEAVLGAYVTKDGKAGPLLLTQKEREKVAYFSSASGMIHESDNSDYVKYGGYYENPYTNSREDGFVPCDNPADILGGLYVSAEGKPAGVERAATELINVYSGKDPLDGLKWEVFLESKAAPWVMGGAAVVVIAIIVVVYVLNKGKCSCETTRWSGQNDNDPPRPPSSPSSDITWHDGNPWVANHNNAKGV